MTLSELDEAERHRVVADGLSYVAHRVANWDAPAPVEGWAARDVVDHLTSWLPEFLTAGGVNLSPDPVAGDDPAAAWRSHARAVQQLLDRPELASRTFTHEQLGSMPLAQAIDRVYTSDVFMHTWDLARASGQEVRLEPEFCRNLLAGMEPMAEVIRASGHFGPPVAVTSDAEAQDRLMGFIGRDPAWRRPGRAR